MYAGIFGAVGVVATPDPDPARFACEIDQRHSPEPLKLRYECRWRPREAQPEEVEEALPRTLASDPDVRVEESCWYFVPDNHPLWRTDDGVVTYNTGEHAVIPAGRTLLNWALAGRWRGEFLFPNMVNPLRDLFWNMVRIPAGIPRGGHERDELVLPYPEPSRNRTLMTSHRLRWLAYRLAEWHAEDRARFDELLALGRRVGLLDEVNVKLYRDAEPNRTTHSKSLVSVEVDGTDLGLLSDGTLRVVEILAWLVFPGQPILLIEEPETAVHPGLLSKLLAELDAYSSDRQIVLSTQSPLVVSWADPAAIRLVERRAGRTEVRNLREAEIGRLSGYLHDEGTLGDFVYSGALDG